jgi:hypothetical protein
MWQLEKIKINGLILYFYWTSQFKRIFRSHTFESKFFYKPILRLCLFTRPFKARTIKVILVHFLFFPTLGILKLNSS